MNNKKTRSTYIQALTLLKTQKLLVTISMLLTITSSLSNTYLALMLRDAIDVLTQETLQNTTIRNFIIKYIGIAAISSFALFLHSIVSTILIEKILLSVRQQVVIHAFSHSMDFFTNEPIGKLITLTTRDLDAIGNFFRNILTQIISSSIAFIIVVGTLFILNTYLALITLGTVPLLILLVNYFRKKILKKSKIVRENTEKINIYLTEHLQGKLDIQLHNKLDTSNKTFTSIADTYYNSRRNLALQEMLLRPFLNLMLIIITIVVIISGNILSIKGFITIGVIIAYIQLIDRFFFPLITIAQNINQVQESLISFNKIFTFLSTKPSITENAPTESIPTHKDTATPTPLSPLHAHHHISQEALTLEFKNVSFAYKDNTLVLKNIDFTLSPNKTIALVGHSGSGKTTIVKLCMRFWDVQQGSITLNGIDIRNIPVHSLRNNIALLHQDSLILHGSIRENIEMGRSIPQKELDILAEKSKLDTIMKRSHLTWDSVIHKKQLSVGEQRIIAICRVLANAPSIVLLDEFSATLDNDTEKTIQSLLKELQKKRGTLIIAHRLNTIKDADEIIYLKEGEIQEKGTHTHLLHKKDHYYNMLQKMRDTIVEKTKI